MKLDKKFLPLIILGGIVILVMLVLFLKFFAPDAVKPSLPGEDTDESTDTGEGINTTLGSSVESSDAPTSTEGDTRPESSPTTGGTAGSSPSATTPGISATTPSPETSTAAPTTGNSTTVPSAGTSTATPSTEGTTQAPSTEASTTVPSTESSTENQPEGDGLSKESAWKIETNGEYVGTMTNATQKHWMSFVTSDRDVVYRIHLDPNVNDSYILDTVKIAIYSERGIQIKEESAEYGEAAFFDILLTKNTKYYLRVYIEHLSKASGDYMVCVEEIARDPAVAEDKSGAFAILTGNEYTGTLNTTFSNWYVCEISETGSYTFTIHNVDVGCTVDFNGQNDSGGSLFYFWAYTESSQSIDFNAKAGEKIYIEISPRDDTANGEYIFSIEKS